MSVTVVIAEKELVAQDIARAFNPKFDRSTKKYGYYSVTTPFGDTLVTWAYGHLLELKEPQDYDERYKEWRLEDLPIIPERFEYKPRKKTYYQFKNILNIFRNNKVKLVINAGDADREGELLVREILDAVGYRGPVKRFWTSEALEPRVVKRVFQELRDGKEFDGLFKEALARQRADWLVGINLTRGVTVAVNDGLLSYGRVQTALLAILAKREREIREFKPEPYWTVSLFLENGKTPFNLIECKALSKFPKLEDREESLEEKIVQGEEGSEENKLARRIFKFKLEKDAKFVANEVKKSGEAEVYKVIRKTKKQAPPKLFSLSALQQEANRLYKFPVKKTLDIAQRLYEVHKMQSYPRTKCEYLAASNKNLVKKSLEMFGFDNPDELIKKAWGRIFNDKKVAEAGHHAIIPIRKESYAKQELTEDEKKIFDLVSKRFIAAFMDPYVYEELTIYLKVKDYYFVATFKRDIDLGWKKVYEKDMKTKKLPPVKEGDVYTITDVKINSDTTKPPPRYTEGSLVGLMKNAHRFVEDERYKNIMRGSEGIGTEATRGPIIDTVKERGYMYVSRNRIFVTDKGLVVDEIAERLGLKVRDVVTTAIWESALGKIRDGEVSFNDFIERIKKMVVSETRKIQKNVSLIREIFQKSKKVFVCPHCQGEMEMNKWGVFCGKCELKVWRKFAGKQLNDNQLAQLVEGKEVLVRGLKSKKGNTYNAYLKLGEDGKISMRFPEGKTGKAAGKGAGKNRTVGKRAAYSKSYSRGRKRAFAKSN